MIWVCDFYKSIMKNFYYFFIIKVIVWIWLNVYVVLKVCGSCFLKVGVINCGEVIYYDIQLYRDFGDLLIVIQDKFKGVCIVG